MRFLSKYLGYRQKIEIRLGGILVLQVFDIIGPIMIGPSSSHTAGAVRIGKYARSVLGKKP